MKPNLKTNEIKFRTASTEAERRAEFREFVFAYVLFTFACILGIIIVLEVTHINDERRADEARIELFELRRAQELRDMAAERCFKAAQLRGLDFVQVCPDWVYDN